MRISQPSELRTAGWACATARAVEAPQRPPTSAGDHRPGFVGLAAPRRPPPPQEVGGMSQRRRLSAAWNVFVKVFVDHDNADNRRIEKE